MRMHPRIGNAPVALLVLMLLATPSLLADEAAAEDVEMSTTFLTFFKNGGGYIEYSINGKAASTLRGMIDDPAVKFPYETMTADGDGMVDPSEGEQYMRNMDDILTRRQIVLRGVKLDNVDVDDHRGLIGSNVNDTDELWLHITFRGHIQYETMEFNVSGLEPIMVLFGSYDDIPDDLTIDERTYIVSAGMGSYSIVKKEEGTLLNMRVPLAAVISYHASYTVGDPPVTRMEYSHSTTLGNPIVLMIFTLIITWLTIKLPKSVAKENGKERVRELHIAILVAVIAFWLFYLLGGATPVVWAFGIAMVVTSYYMAHRIYAQDWRGMAQSLDGIDMGEALTPVDLANGDHSANGREVRTAPLIGEAGHARIADGPEGDVILVSPDEGMVEDDVLLRPVVIPAPVTQPQVQPQPQPQPQAVQYRAIAPAATPVQSQAQPQAPPQVQPPPQPQPAAEAQPPATVGEKSMRCKCGGVFKVPLQPRPLEVRCPHCGITGVLRS